MAPRKINADIALRKFFSDNARFASVFNTYYFDGQAVVQPEDLYAMDSEAAAVIPGSEKLLSIVRRGDVVRLWKTETTMDILILEIQSYIDYGMPLRHKAEEVAFLDSQRTALKKKHAGQKLNRDEFLSGMTLDDRLVPVSILTLYFGENVWDAYKELEEMYVPHRMPRKGNDALIAEVQRTETRLIQNMEEAVRILLELTQLRYNVPRKKRAAMLAAYFAEHSTEKLDREIVAAVLGRDTLRIYDAVEQKKREGGDMRPLLGNLDQEITEALNPQWAREQKKLRRKLRRQRQSVKRARAETQTAQAVAQTAQAVAQTAQAEAQAAKEETQQVQDALRNAAAVIYQTMTKLHVPYNIILQEISRVTGVGEDSVAEWLNLGQEPKA
ncbi:MAG: hypothetical protein HDQ87_08670 [Clostridia bacterium]|nr:hypothetical protein [Clostridia bacterium]